MKSLIKFVPTNVQDSYQVLQEMKDIDKLPQNVRLFTADDNFRMNTRSGRYGATYNMVGLRCFNEELSLLPKNPTEAKLQATSTRGESTEPT
jgi:hypothetical protein